MRSVSSVRSAHREARPGEPAFLLCGDLRFFALPGLLAAQVIQREILRGLREPRGGIVRHAAIRPGLQRPHERFLHHVLGELQPVPKLTRSLASSGRRQDFASTRS